MAYSLVASAPRQERPQSLVLCGPSRLGKTQFARSLGPHVYIANMWDLGAFDGLKETFWQHGYVVFDDIEWTSIASSAKSWFGAQADFSVSDKYRRKRRIRGSLPLIFLINPDAWCGDLRSFVTGPWGQKNISFVNINDKLY